MDWSLRPERWLSEEDLNYVKGHVVMTDVQLAALQHQIHILRDINRKLKAMRRSTALSRMKNKQHDYRKASVGQSGLDIPAVRDPAEGTADLASSDGRNDAIVIDIPSVRKELPRRRNSTRGSKRSFFPRTQSSACKRGKNSSKRASLHAASGPVLHRQSARPRKKISYADMELVDSPRHKTRGYDFVEECRLDDKPVELPLLTPVRYNGDGVEQSCSTCGERDDGDPSNPLLSCHGVSCHVVIHLHCCGLEDVPQGEWLCDGCKDGLSPDESNCVMCPVVGGAVKQVVSVGSVMVPLKGQHCEKRSHVHLACALWVPEVHFRNPDALSGVELDGITQARANLKCIICKQGGGGSIQCYYGNCCQAFHSLCARSKGWTVTFCASGTTAAFCGKHSFGLRFAEERERIIKSGLPAAASSGLDESDGSEEGLGNEPQSNYEQERLKNIERNKLILKQLNETQL